MIKTKINKGIINCLLSESAKVREYIDLLKVYTPTNGAVLCKLVYYQRSIWEQKVEVEEEGSLLLSDNVQLALEKERAGEEDNDGLKYGAGDGVLPYIVIIDPGSAEGLSIGDIRQVDPKAITGEVHTDEFISFAKAIQQDRHDNEGNPMLEAKKKNIQVEITALEKNWGRYRVSMPWLELDKYNMNSYLFYELHLPHIRGTVNQETLKNLLDVAGEE